MSATWLPCGPEDVVVGDAVALSGRDRTGDAWTLSGRVRARGENGTVIVEFTTTTGAGDPPWRLWTNQIVRRDRLLAHGLRRHPEHGPAERTDASGEAYLRSLVAGADLRRLADCIRPGPDGMRVGEVQAERILSGREAAMEWMVRQLDGRMSAEAAKAYVPVVQASRAEVPAPVVERRRPAGPRVPADDPIYSDPDIKGLLAGLPGAFIKKVRHRRRTEAGWVEDAEV